MPQQTYDRCDVTLEPLRLWFARWTMRLGASIVRAGVRTLPECHPVRIFLESQTKRTERAVSLALVDGGDPEKIEARDRKIAGLVVSLAIGGASVALIVQTVTDFVAP